MVVCTQHPALWQSSSHPVPQSRTLTLCFLFFLGFQILIILKENFISVMMSFPIFLPLMSGSGSSFLSQDLSAVSVPCLWTCTGFNILCLMALVIVGDGIWYWAGILCMCTWKPNVDMLSIFPWSCSAFSFSCYC